MNHAVNTLEYLHKGGRIGGAAHLIGSILSLKPILHMTDDGIVGPLDRVRTRKRALQRLLTLLEEIVDPSKPLHVGVLHGNAAEEAATLKDAVIERWQPAAFMESWVGATVGTHTGPGVIGFGFLQ